MPVDEFTGKMKGNRWVKAKYVMLMNIHEYPDLSQYSCET